MSPKKGEPSAWWSVPVESFTAVRKFDCDPQVIVFSQPPLDSHMLWEGTTKPMSFDERSAASFDTTDVSAHTVSFDEQSAASFDVLESPASSMESHKDRLDRVVESARAHTDDARARAEIARSKARLASEAANVARFHADAAKQARAEKEAARLEAQAAAAAIKMGGMTEAGRQESQMVADVVRLGRKRLEDRRQLVARGGA
jgi:hypothetical protein